MSYIHTDNDIEREDEDLMVAETVQRTRRTTGMEEMDERDRGLIMARVIHHVGGGIRWSYNRNLAYAFGIALGVHLALIGLYMLSTIGDDPIVAAPVRSLPPLTLDTASLIQIDMSDVVVLKEGGGGGDVTSKEPVGESKAGDPNAAPKYVAEKPRTDLPEKVFDPKAPTKIKTVDKPKVNDRPVTTDRDTNKVASSGAGNKGQHADGKGTKEAGGSGGLGVGNGVGIGVGDGSGMGGRGWIRRPKGGRSSTLSASGRVVLQFTVMPDGEITNIRPIKKAHPSLVDEAVRRLSAAKARPLPEDQPQKPFTTSIPFNFDVQ